MLKYLELKTKPREFLAATGHTDEEFQALLPAFATCYESTRPPKPKPTKKKKQRARGGGRRGQLPDLADKLLFILIYQKTFPLQVMHGLQFGLSQGQVNHWIHRLLPVLQASLALLNLAPERDGSAVATAVEASAGGPNLSLDGTERRVQRPVEAVQQREKYSGKKKTHTEKNLVLVNEHTQRVVYLSPTVAGKRHDKKLAETSEIRYPAHATLTQDTGFQGYEPAGVLTAQPKKSRAGRS
jgi:DDE superfamily endonuclease/Helix-turn-helix of DDE superfamily endonuclease